MSDPTVPDAAASAAVTPDAPAEPPLRRRDLRSERHEKGLLRYLGLGLGAGLLAFVVLVAVLAIVVPALSGSTTYTILTRSMEPSMPPGTMIVVTPTPASELRIGDAITYQIESGKPDVITHRIISIIHVSDGTLRFTTQGDNNAAADETDVIEEQLRGKVWYSIPYLGWVSAFMNGENRVWIVPVLAAGLFTYAGYLVAGSIVGKRRQRKARDEARTARRAR